MATPVAVGPGPNGVVGCSGQLNPNENDGQDWYRFNVLAGQRISVSATPNIRFDFDLCVAPPTNTVPVVCGSRPIGDPQAIVYEATSSGAWRVRLTAGGSGEYALTIGIDVVPQQIATVAYPQNGSESIAANYITGRVYSGHSSTATMTVIDGNANSVIASLPLPCITRDIAVRANNNKIYVAGQQFGICVVDGGTHLVERIPITTTAIAVDAQRNLVYGVSPGELTVIDGTTHQTIRTHALNQANYVAVNEATGEVFISENTAVAILSGSTIVRVPVGGLPGFSPLLAGIAVNSATNIAYVAAPTIDKVIVIDGTSRQRLPDTMVGVRPWDVAVDPNTNRVFITNIVSETLSILDGATHRNVGTVSTGRRPHGVAVNTVASRIYAANEGAGTATVFLDDRVSPETEADQESGSDLPNGDAPVDPGDLISVSFTGTDNFTPSANLRFECQVDDTGFSPCTSPVSVGSRVLGQHTFEVHAIDQFGNVDASPASISWEVAFDPPSSDILTLDGALLPAVGHAGGSVVEGSSSTPGGFGEIQITFEPLTGGLTGLPGVWTTAHASCADLERTECAWEATVPELPGEYLVTIQAFDSVGGAEPYGASQIVVIVV